MAQPSKDEQYNFDDIWLPDNALPEISNGDSWDDDEWQEWLSIGNSVGLVDGTSTSGSSFGSPDSAQWSSIQDEWLGDVDEVTPPGHLLRQLPVKDFTVDQIYGQNASTLDVMSLDTTTSSDTNIISPAEESLLPSSFVIEGLNDAADNSLEALLTSALLAEEQRQRHTPHQEISGADCKSQETCQGSVPGSATRPGNDGQKATGRASKGDQASRQQKTRRKRRPKHELRTSVKQPAERRAEPLPHAVIEERYRKKLIDTFAELRDLCKDVPGLGEARKNNKAAVMGRAAEYIRYLEKKNRSISDELERVKKQNIAKKDAWP